MTTNDKLRRLRYALDLSDRETVRLFGLADYALEPAELAALFAKDDDPNFDPCPDAIARLFLKGLIISRRGRRDQAESGQTPPGFLFNNEILKAIRVALELRDDEIVAAMAAAGAEISKSQLAALFRKPGHANYRPCGDQFLRNFLMGLTIQRRGKK